MSLRGKIKRAIFYLKYVKSGLMFESILPVVLDTRVGVTLE